MMHTLPPDRDPAHQARRDQERHQPQEKATIALPSSVPMQQAGARRAESPPSSWPPTARKVGQKARRRGGVPGARSSDRSTSKTPSRQEVERRSRARSSVRSPRATDSTAPDASAKRSAASHAPGTSSMPKAGTRAARIRDVQQHVVQVIAQRLQFPEGVLPNERSYRSAEVLRGCIQGNQIRRQAVLGPQQGVWYIASSSQKGRTRAQAGR